MPPPSRSIILPSENQAREFDAKLLLACMLAEAGAAVFVGARHEVHNEIGNLPRSLYVAKDFRKPSVRIFDIMDRLGHDIVAWDEEGLITAPPDIYYQRRVALPAIEKVRMFFAWGPRSRELIENAPGFPGVPVHATGNPRIDMLRPEVRAFYEAEAARLRATYGRFVLFNSNFGSINHFITTLSVRPGELDPLMKSAPSAHQSAVWKHRLDMFGRFQAVLPKLAARCPETTIVIRPHPSEGHDVWRKLAEDCPNIAVVHESSVIPWLLAARVMIHNSCSTGVEAFLLDRPAIAFRPIADGPGEPELPNALSVEATSEDALLDLVERQLTQEDPLPKTSRQHIELRKMLAATEGPLASEAITTHLINYLAQNAPLRRSMPTRWSGRAKAAWRKRGKLAHASDPEHKAGQKHNLHRYPGISPEGVEDRIARLRHLLGRFDSVTAHRWKGQIYRIARD